MADSTLITNIPHDQKLKLLEIEREYSNRIRDLRKKSLMLVTDYLKKADEYEANQIITKLKGKYGG